MTQFHDSEYRPTGLLYHYTSLDALASIVEHGCMWASSVHYMNDARESSLGLSLLRDHVHRECASATGGDLDFLNFLLPWVEDHTAWNQHVFVLCFSESRDQLSQWRGYTSHGRGVCIGLHAGALISEMQRRNWTFQCCRYRQASQMAYVNAILTRMRREASEAPSGANLNEHYGKVLGRCLSEVLRIAAFIKHPAFEEEREVRFISPPMKLDDASVKYRVGRTTIIPYVEFSLRGTSPDGQAPPPLFTEVIVGPTQTPHLSEISTDGLLRRHGVNLVQRVNSTIIPYREL